MPFVVKDRVQETTTTTGTGTLTLAGAVAGFQSFSVIGNANTTYYAITNGTDWEVGIGTYTSSGTTLSRDTILESSNAGSAVNWGAGTKNVFCTYAAERSVYVEGSSIVPASSATLPISSGGTGQTTANAALNALLPSQTSNSGKFLKTDGTNTSWDTAGGASKTLAVFTPLDNQPPASNFATLDTRNSIAVLDFDGGSTNEEAVFVGVIPQGATLTSGLKVRIFWMATSATSGNCRWGAQFERGTTDLDTDSFDTATEGHSATNGTSGIVTITELTCTSIDSLAAGDNFRLKIYRDASDTTNDTMTGDAELIAVELQQVA